MTSLVGEANQNFKAASTEEAVGGPPSSSSYGRDFCPLVTHHFKMNQHENLDGNFYYKL